MAILKVKSEYVGPGEKKTAEQLRDELPDDWVIFAGRKLPGPTRDDVDLIIVGKGLIFTVEEKAWGPRVVVDDNFWRVNEHSDRANPLNRIGQLSRKVAEILRTHANGYKNLPGKRVVPAVIMSHDHLEMFGGRNHDRNELIWRLKDAAVELKKLDAAAAAMGGPRAAVVKYLDDMPARGGQFALGDYTVIDRLDVPGIEQAYVAEAAGKRVILKCYPIDALRELGDPIEFLQRETNAINRLADLNRTWQAYPYFEDGAEGLFIVPVALPGQARSLADAISEPGPERPDGVLNQDTARQVLIDAYTALSEVHEFGLIHRALHPRRIWLGRAMRVMFSDFHLARLPDAQTIALWVGDGDVSEDYRAAECVGNVGLATERSDVFSLSLCMASWLLGKDAVELTVDEIGEQVTAMYAWATPLLAGLSGAIKERPRAAEIAEALTPSAPEHAVSEVAPAPDTFEIGALISGRYEIKKALGEGGFARSWLVYDKQTEHRKVLKEFKHGVPEELRTEYLAANQLSHDRCGRVYDMQLELEPNYLVSEYVEGDGLDTANADRDVEEMRTIARGVLQALSYIHSKDLVHGDVTPGNVIVAADGSSCKLIDFGLAVPSGHRPIGWTPKFAAPEIITGETALPASDLFGAAATIAYAMLGRPISRIVEGVVEIDPPTTTELETWGQEGAALLNAVLTGAAADPADRPESAEAFERIIASAKSSPTPSPTDRDDPVMVDVELSPVINQNVDAIRRLYRASKSGNAGNRGLDDEFAKATYVPTLLDKELLPRVINGDLDVVLLSGNPGDGKTSVLVQLGDLLRAQGAVEEHRDEAGWRLLLNGRRFIAVYDASESHGELTSDDLVKQALDPVLGPEPATALIAVNDGRLLQFFTDYSDDYEEWAFAVSDQLEGRDPGESRLALVDLKRRSLAKLDEDPGLASQVLSTLTAGDLWAPCHGCSAQARCPILANRNLLAGSGGRAFSELILISHLRRRRRATFRDVRSAAAWILTGDKSCEDIHEWESHGRSSEFLERSYTQELAFDTASNDYLIDEWSDLDPAMVAAPTVDSRRRALGTDQYRSAAEVARGLYFGPVPSSAEDPAPRDVRAYRYLDEFKQMLLDPGSADVLSRLLSGISRLVGAFGYDDEGLAMSSGMPGSPWAVLHTIPADQFSVTTPRASRAYVESIPDQLLLEHESGSVTLTLDTAEIILRAADGEIINDAASDAIRQEIDSFVSQLGRHPSRAARIVDSSGSVALARVNGPTITLEQA